MAINVNSIIKPKSLSFNDALVKASKVALQKVERDITLYVLAYKDEDEKIKEQELKTLTTEMVNQYIKYINFYTKEQDEMLKLFNDNVNDYIPCMLETQGQMLKDLINNIWNS